MTAPHSTLIEDTRVGQNARRTPLDLLFISWAPFCSRSDNIARELGGRSLMIYHGFWGSSYWTVLFKYLTQSLATLVALLRRRPRCVFVMSPPAAACLPVWLYVFFFRARFVIDAHTAAFVDPRWQALGFVQRFFARRAVTTLVTNEHWQALVQSWGGRCDIVSDVPVQFPAPEPIELPHGFNVAVVSTFTFDEPTEVMFHAAAQVPEVTFHVTGNFRRVPPAVLATKPSNVRLTGFIPDAQYVSLLQRCNAVMSLTTLDHTMQRGAYEAAYLGRPIVTSDFGLLRRTFCKGAVFARGEAAAIAGAVREMQANHSRYAREALELARDKLDQWQRVRARLAALVGAENRI